MQCSSDINGTNACNVNACINDTNKLNNKKAKNMAFVRMIVFCFVVVVCVCFLNFLLVPWSSLDQKFDTYKLADGKIQALILGSSLEERIDRSLIADTFGFDTFTFSPQSGYPETSYYILLNAITTNDIKLVIAGWDLSQMFEVPHHKYPHEEEFYRSFLPYLLHSKKIAHYVIKGILLQPYTYSFFKYASFPENLPVTKQVQRSKKQKKQNSVTRFFTVATMTQEAKTAQAPQENVPIKKEHTVDPLDIENPRFNYHEIVDRKYKSTPYQSDIEYIKKIKDLCQEKNIPLYFLACPFPSVVINALPQFHDMYENSRLMFESLGVAFIDTLDKDVFPDITNNENFKDCAGHLSDKYVPIYTKGIIKSIKGL